MANRAIVRQLSNMAVIFLHHLERGQLRAANHLRESRVGMYDIPNLAIEQLVLFRISEHFLRDLGARGVRRSDDLSERGIDVNGTKQSIGLRVFLSGLFSHDVESMN